MKLSKKVGQGGFVTLKRLSLWIILLLVFFSALIPGARAQVYQNLKSELCTGWNTWNNRNMLSFVHLPEALAVNIHFKKNTRSHEHWLNEAVVERVPRTVAVRPGYHAYDGSYTEMTLNYRWYGSSEFKIESAHDGKDLLILITPMNEETAPLSVVAELGFLWNRPGKTFLRGDVAVAQAQNFETELHACNTTYPEYNVPFTGVYLAVKADGPVAFCTGKKRSLEEIKEAIAAARRAFISSHNQYIPQDELSRVIHSALAWNTAYDPHKQRLLTTVSREWSAGGGGYMIFGWDNFLCAYVMSLHRPAAAKQNMLAVFEEMVNNEFVPNNSYASGQKTLDRSQPPVASFLFWKVYERNPDKIFLEEAFSSLLNWNRWWMKNRLNGNMLSYGSNDVPNPDKSVWHYNLGGAKMESGLDNSPMYDSAVFNEKTAMMELHDVGLNSLYALDCQYLAKIAALLGKKSEEKELQTRARQFAGGVAKLWDDKKGIYLNYDTRQKSPSNRLSPTLFYPLLAQIPSEKQVARMVKEHLLDTASFYTDFILPSSPKNDPAFAYHKYWRGAVWPPLNFYVYQGLKNYRAGQIYARLLAERSAALLMAEWNAKGAIGENYSAITGTVDAEHVKSHPFYSWGVLLGVMLIEEEMGGVR